MKNVSHQVVPMFPTPLCLIGEKYKFSDKEYKAVMSYFDVTNKNSTGNNITRNKYILENKALSKFKKWLTMHVNGYASSLIGVNETKCKFHITQSWANINRYKESHHKHNHPNSIISGVFYVDGEDGDIIFHKQTDFEEHGWHLPIKDRTKFPFSNNEFGINFKKDSLLLFPSRIIHYVNVNESDKPRISIAFNTFFKGKIGHYDDATELEVK
tara:strand:+ start:4949 stop:5587 length:639 start_codon:yes stop_codon:yes gene_type:complete